MSALEKTAAALALCLAASANAQAPAAAPAPGGAWPSAQQQRRAGQAAQPAQPAQGAQSQLTQEQLQAIGVVWILSQHHAALGDLAKARGASADVQKYAQGVEEGHKNSFQPALTKLLKERGVDPSSLPQPPERQQVDQEMKQVAGLSGPAFDRALVTFMKRHGEEFVDALKRAREATPGSDPALKKLLDQAEDSEEVYLTSARQMDAAQVQGRTPPAR
jgi:putative membrane protein